MWWCISKLWYLSRQKVAPHSGYLDCNQPEFWGFFHLVSSTHSLDTNKKLNINRNTFCTGYHDLQQPVSQNCLCNLLWFLLSHQFKPNKSQVLERDRCSFQWRILRFYKIEIWKTFPICFSKINPKACWGIQQKIFSREILKHTLFEIKSDDLLSILSIGEYYTFWVTFLIIKQHTK